MVQENKAVTAQYEFSRSAAFREAIFARVVAQMQGGVGEENEPTVRDRVLSAEDTSISNNHLQCSVCFELISEGKGEDLHEEGCPWLMYSADRLVVFLGTQSTLFMPF